MSHVSDVTWRVVPGSIDGHALQLDELKGTKPTEKIDLSGKGLGVASGIIIATCIKENHVLKELECAAHPSVLAAARARSHPSVLAAAHAARSHPSGVPEAMRDLRFEEAPV